MALPKEAAEIIARLDLKPHPEGGHYRETFRDKSLDTGGRSRSTAIYFLLARGERSHWHRVDAVETWHYYSGATLTLKIADEGGDRSVALGPDLAAGEVPQASCQRCVAGGGEHGRLDAGGLHRCARIRICEIRARD